MHYSGVDIRMPTSAPLADVSLQFSGIHSTLGFQAIDEKQTAELQNSVLLNEQNYLILEYDIALLTSILLYNSIR